MQNTKLHGRPIQKFEGKVVSLIYTICSKNLTTKGFHQVFLQMMRKLFGMKKQQQKIPKKMSGLTNSLEISPQHILQKLMYANILN